MFSFIGHGAARPRLVLGLPARCELGPDLLPYGVPLAGRCTGIESLQKKIGDSLLLAQQGAARRVGRMGSKDWRDRRPPQHGHDLVEGDAAVAQLGYRRLQAVTLRQGTVEVATPPPDPMDLLGKVNDLEPGGKRAGELLRLRRRTTGQVSAQQADIGLAVALGIECD